MRKTLKDILFFYSFLIPTVFIIIILFLIFYSQISLSRPIFEVQGLKTFIGTRWYPSYEPPPTGAKYELLPAIIGSIYVSIIALLLSLPLSLCIVAFLNELAPKRIGKVINFTLDLLAGLPSVIYGIWGLYFLGPFLNKYVMGPLHDNLGFLPFFSCYPLSSASILTGGVLISFMIMPFQIALIDEMYRNVPRKYIEAAYSIGATLYEQVKIRFSIIRGAIVSAALLGFGRAVGETAAISLVIGNVYYMSACVFSPAYTISSLIVNQFTESQDFPFMLNALFAGSLFLLILGLVINIIGVMMLRRVRL